MAVLFAALQCVLRVNSIMVYQQHQHHHQIHAISILEDSHLLNACMFESIRAPFPFDKMGASKHLLCRSKGGCCSCVQEVQELYWFTMAKVGPRSCPLSLSCLSNFARLPYLSPASSLLKAHANGHPPSSWDQSPRPRGIFYTIGKLFTYMDENTSWPLRDPPGLSPFSLLYPRQR